MISTMYLQSDDIILFLDLDLRDADCSPVDVRVLLMSVKTRAWLALVILMVPVNVTVVDFDQISDQLQKSGLLCSCSCVSKLSRLVETANVTNANTVSVVTVTVRTSFTNEPTPLNGAIKTYDVMVPNIFPSPSEWRGRSMILFNLFGPDVDFVFGTRAVDDDLINYSHVLSFQI